jgi:phosphoserine phosphatase
MRYKIIVFDIDGTITRHVSSWRYIHEKLGLWDVLAKKYQEQFLAGKISYRRFCELDAAHWRGTEEVRLRRAFDSVKYSKNAAWVIRRFKTMGFRLVAVSTGLQFIADRVRDELGVDHVISNRLNVRAGKMTGGVRINIGHGAKGKTVKGILKKFGARPEQMIAVGDTEGDIPMMKIAGLSIAFNSSSERLSKMVDYNCASDDFREVYEAVLDGLR